jgi:hypothetical protein
MVVAAEGTVYANTWSGRYFPNSLPPPGVVERFGATVENGGAGRSGNRIFNGRLYAEEADRIERYDLTPGSVTSKGPPEVVVSGLPLTGIIPCTIYH